MRVTAIYDIHGNLPALEAVSRAERNMPKPPSEGEMRNAFVRAELK
jgi:hypothetical protein